MPSLFGCAKTESRSLLLLGRGLPSDPGFDLRMKTLDSRRTAPCMREASSGWPFIALASGAPAAISSQRSPSMRQRREDMTIVRWRKVNEGKQKWNVLHLCERLIAGTSLTAGVCLSRKLTRHICLRRFARIVTGLQASHAFYYCMTMQVSRFEPRTTGVCGSHSLLPLPWW